MTVTAGGLAGFSSPYDDWHDGFLEAARQIESFDGDSDGLTMLLFNELWQNVEHQLTLFDSLLPALPSLSTLLARRPDLTDTALWFLAYVLRWPIRQRGLLLVEPVTFPYLKPRQVEPGPTERALVEACGQFYSEHRSSLDGWRLPAVLRCPISRRAARRHAGLQG